MPGSTNGTPGTTAPSAQPAGRPAVPALLASPTEIGKLRLRARRISRAWKSIHERLVWEQLPLTPLISTASKHSSSGDPDRSIRVVGLRDGGSEIEYGILAEPYSRLSFRLRLGRRPYFTTRLRVLGRASRPPVGRTEFVVDLEVDGTHHRLIERTLSAGGVERRQRLRVDLARWEGKEVTLVLRTRVVGSDAPGDLPMVWSEPRVMARRRKGDQISRFGQDLRRLGPGGTARALVDAMRGDLVLNDGQALYQLWIEKHAPGPDGVRKMSDAAGRFDYRPLISIATPVYNTEPRWLRACIESVRQQIYPRWELCLVDDASTDPEVRSILDEYAALDPRIRVDSLPLNSGIAGASNRAAAMAAGEFVGLLDHDDELAPDALYQVVALLQEQREADIVYSDEDKIEEDGTRTQPFFKPDWSPEFLLSCMYTCHFTVYRKALFDRVGGFRPGFEGSQDYDLMLRATGETDRIHHVPRVLYHWRRANGSASDTRAAKPYAYDAGRRALEDHIRRQGRAADLAPAKLYGFYRVRYAVPESARVSIVILTRDRVNLLRACIESIEARTSHPNYEILVVDNDSREAATHDYFGTLSHPVLRAPGEFNYSRLNNFGASRTTGDYLVFLNNDTEVIAPEWLTAMLEFCQQPEIGIVGARLLFPDGRIQHAGIALGLGGVAGHLLSGFPAGTSHYFGFAGVIRNCTAVTGACLMTRREVFEAVGGFDESLPGAYNDVDFCLRVRERGLRAVWTPFAELYHHESATRAAAVEPGEILRMRARWGPRLARDPYYNPNLTLEHSDLRVRL